MLKNFLKNTLVLIVGSIVFSAGFCIFALPNSLLTGGAGGIATVINYLTGFPVGTTILLINLPLFIGALYICGKRYAVKTLYSTAVFSFVIDIFDAAVKFEYTKSLALATLFSISC